MASKVLTKERLEEIRAVIEDEVETHAELTFGYPDEVLAAAADLLGYVETLQGALDFRDALKGMGAEEPLISIELSDESERSPDFALAGTGFAQLTYRFLRTGPSGDMIASVDDFGYWYVLPETLRLGPYTDVTIKLAEERPG